MAGLTIIQWINIIAAVLILIPTAVSIKHYYRTGIVDFLIFGLFFAMIFLTLSGNVLASITNILFFYQLHYGAWISNTILLLLHVIRMRWGRFQKIAWYIGVVWFSVLAFLIILWKIMLQPETSSFLNLVIPHLYSSYHPSGAGIMIADGLILFSTSHRIICQLFFIYAFCVALYSYLTIKPFVSTDRIILAHKLWIIAIIATVVYFVMSLPWAPQIAFLNALLILTFILIAYIAIRLPEAMIITEVQVHRAIHLYKKVQELTTAKAVKDFGMPELVKYLKECMYIVQGDKNAKIKS